VRTQGFSKEYEMPIKILVVDDEPDLEFLIRQKFRKQVRDGEFELHFAGNGIEALEKLHADRTIDLVLSDINMPQMDGLTLLGKLGELGPTPKAVVVSAYGDMDNIRTAMNRGAFDFLTKPIDFHDLEITIQKTLQELMLLKQALQTRDQLVALQRELTIANQIQQSILPQTFPPFPDRTEFEIYAQMIPARDVGGDFYDFFLVGDGRLGFVIADVSGKGVPASIFMAMSRTMLKATALTGASTSDCLRHVNQMLCSESDSGMFVTTCYGVLEVQTGELEYCTGGHHPPYLLSASGDVSHLELTNGMVLGLMDDAEFQAKRITLRPGDKIVLYTDGVTEAMDAADALFSEQRLKDLLQRVNGSSLEAITQHVIAEVKNFSAGVPQTDDITVLALKYLGR
jgi:sigma-B regulation protein RsbU (phosphoserine phosphatase)